ncbi:MAG: tetratricopeptide repeat protein [Proteobacteria bacterium]|nr:tetratricopeptide repeat protein [Pseudomonadota bacterium]MDA1057509.1 tetratricopeptide repeat protein [Pseudomonadota bacterium]
MKRFIFAVLAGLLLLAQLQSTAFARQDDARLTELFSRLQQTGDEQEARLIEGLIWRLWFESGSPDTDRLIQAGNDAMGAGRFEEALNRFSRVIEVDPSFAEGWNRRATLYYLMGNYEASVRDIQETLLREPRHFGALSGLGLINSTLERWESAMKAYEEALRVNPHLPGAKKNVEDIKKKMEQDI